jgi:ERCC4-type nuclease
MSFKLLVDERERSVHRYSLELWSNIKWEKSTITIGDYAIIFNDEENETENTRIIYSIERKSLADFASSFKDGRHDNKNKLRYLQRRTGCRVMYIIEGPRKNANQLVGNIPYGNIESSIIHMETEYRWCFHYTNDEIDTAKFISRLISSLYTLYKQDKLPLEQFNILSNKNTINIDTNKIKGGHTDNLTEYNEVKALLLIEQDEKEINKLQQGNDSSIEETILNEEIIEIKIPDPLTINEIMVLPFNKSVESVVREMWAAIPGIAVTNAIIFMKYSLREIIEGINKVELKKITYSNGRLIATRTINKLCSLNSDDHLKILSRLPKLSKQVANLILVEKTLSEFLKMIDNPIEFDKFIYAGNKKLRKDVKDNIITYFSFKIT